MSVYKFVSMFMDRNYSLMAFNSYYRKHIKRKFIQQLIDHNGSINKYLECTFLHHNCSIVRISKIFIGKKG